MAALNQDVDTFINSRKNYLAPNLGEFEFIMLSLGSSMSDCAANFFFGYLHLFVESRLNYKLPGKLAVSMQTPRVLFLLTVDM